MCADLLDLAVFLLVVESGEYCAEMSEKIRRLWGYI
jgi:hypothetical protein